MAQTGDGPNGGPTYRTPRWVKVFGIITLIVVLVIVVVLVTGLGGPHGPRRHGLLQPPAPSFRFPVFLLAIVGFRSPSPPSGLVDLLGPQPTTTNRSPNLTTGHSALTTFLAATAA